MESLIDLYAEYLENFKEKYGTSYLKTLEEEEVLKNIPNIKVDMEKFYLLLRVYSLEPRDFMMVFQNPAFPTKKKDERMNKEYNQLVSHGYDIEKIQETNSKFLFEWLEEGTNNSRSKNLFYTLSKYLEAFDFKKDRGWKKIPNNQLLDSFYITDLVKMQMTTKLNSKKIRDDSIEFLCDEIQLVDPKIVFLVSSRTWETFYNYYSNKNNLDILLGQNIENLDKVTRVHGVPFCDDNRIFIPLSHFSGMNAFLRDSYTCYLEQGLEEAKGVYPEYFKE